MRTIWTAVAKRVAQTPLWLVIVDDFGPAHGGDSALGEGTATGIQNAMQVTVPVGVRCGICATPNRPIFGGIDGEGCWGLELKRSRRAWGARRLR